MALQVLMSGTEQAQIVKHNRMLKGSFISERILQRDELMIQLEVHVVVPGVCVLILLV